MMWRAMSCSPRQGMPCKSGYEGSNCVSMTQQEMSFTDSAMA